MEIKSTLLHEITEEADSEINDRSFLYLYPGFFILIYLGYFFAVFKGEFSISLLITAFIGIFFTLFLGFRNRTRRFDTIKLHPFKIKIDDDIVITRFIFDNKLFKLKVNKKESDVVITNLKKCFIADGMLTKKSLVLVTDKGRYFFPDEKKNLIQLKKALDKFINEA